MMFFFLCNLNTFYFSIDWSLFSYFIFNTFSNLWYIICNEQKKETNKDKKLWLWFPLILKEQSSRKIVHFKITALKFYM